MLALPQAKIAGVCRQLAWRLGLWYWSLGNKASLCLRVEYFQMYNCWRLPSGIPRRYSYHQFPVLLILWREKRAGRIVWPVCYSCWCRFCFGAHSLSSQHTSRGYVNRSTKKFIKVTNIVNTTKFVKQRNSWIQFNTRNNDYISLFRLYKQWCTFENFQRSLRYLVESLWNRLM